jgi:hypothetical protein
MTGRRFLRVILSIGRQALRHNPPYEEDACRTRFLRSLAKDPPSEGVSEGGSVVVALTG